MIGTWKNVEELEESLTLAELMAILVAANNKEHRTFKFMGALNGVDIDKGRKGRDQENDDDEDSISEHEAASFGLAFSSEGESVGEDENING